MLSANDIIIYHINLVFLGFFVSLFCGNQNTKSGLAKPDYSYMHLFISGKVYPDSW